MLGRWGCIRVCLVFKNAKSTFVQTKTFVHECSCISYFNWLLLSETFLLYFNRLLQSEFGNHQSKFKMGELGGS